MHRLTTAAAIETPAFLHWNLATCNYASMGYIDSGNVLCDQPWSGHFNLTRNSGFWEAAHYARFAPATGGWRIARASHVLDNATCATCQLTPTSSVITVFNATDFSCLLGGTPGQNVTIVLHGALAASVREVTLWTGDTNATRGTVAESFARGLYQSGGAIPVLPGGRIVVDARRFQAGGERHTITSLRGIRSSAEVGESVHAVPEWAPFPASYRDAFDGAGSTQGSLPRHFSDQGGVFEMVASGGGRAGVLSQQVLREPGVNRWCGNPDPVTVIGNEQWRETAACVDAWLPGSALPVRQQSQLRLAPCDAASASQRFRYDAASQQLRDAGSTGDQCWNVVGGAPHAGVALQMYPCGADEPSRFQLRSDGTIAYLHGASSSRGG